MAIDMDRSLHNTAETGRWVTCTRLNGLGLHPLSLTIWYHILIVCSTSFVCYCFLLNFCYILIFIVSYLESQRKAAYKSFNINQYKKYFSLKEGCVLIDSDSDLLYSELSIEIENVSRNHVGWGCCSMVTDTSSFQISELTLMMRRSYIPCCKCIHVLHHSCFTVKRCVTFIYYPDWDGYYCQLTGAGNTFT